MHDHTVVDLIPHCDGGRTFERADGLGFDLLECARATGLHSSSLELEQGQRQALRRHGPSAEREQRRAPKPVPKPEKIPERIPRVRP